MPLRTCSVTLSCPTLFDSMVCSSSVHGILQARVLEWGAISYSRGSSQPRIKLTSPAFAGGSFTTSPTWEAQCPSRKPRKHSPEATLPRGFHPLTWALGSSWVSTHTSPTSQVFVIGIHKKSNLKNFLRTFSNLPGLSFPENLTIHWLLSQAHSTNSQIWVHNCS